MVTKLFRRIALLILVRLIICVGTHQHKGRCHVVILQDDKLQVQDNTREMTMGKSKDQGLTQTTAVLLHPEQISFSVKVSVLMNLITQSSRSSR